MAEPNETIEPTTTVASREQAAAPVGSVGVSLPRASDLVLARAQWRRGLPWLTRSVPHRGVVVATVTGEVDHDGLGLLSRGLEQLLDEPGLHALVVDCSQVGFLCLSGVELLLAAAGQAGAHRRELLAVVGSPAGRRAFEVTGAEAVIHTYRHLVEAVTAAKARADYQIALGSEVS